MSNFSKKPRRLSRNALKSIIWAAIITVVVAIVIAYFAIPAATIRNEKTATFIFVVLSIFVIAFNLRHSYRYPGETDIRHLSRVTWCLLTTAIIIMGVLSMTCFYAKTAQSVAQVTVKDSFDKDFPDIKEGTDNLALIDLDSAIMLGDKQVAALEHASWYDVDDSEWNLIQYNGKYYRLAFLDYGGIWKHHKAKTDGIPGYILVECTPDGDVVTQNASLVKLDEPIRYSEGAYWSHDLNRHLRRQYPSYVFDKSFAEIDDNGTPYYITGVLRPQRGVWGIKTIESFILTNAQTGESTEYAVDYAPTWIDHIFSLDYLTRIAEWHYTYRDGFLNTLLSNTNVWHTSFYYRDNRTYEEDGQFANFYGYSSVVLNGDVQFYTGLTAANNADSNLGWLFMDTSTGQMTEYPIVGAEESSAQKAIEQLVSAYRYQATFPLPVNIAGEPSYIMCLKGDAGLVQAYGICNVQNYSIAVQAETLPEAISQYLTRLGKPSQITGTEVTAEPSQIADTEVTVEANPSDKLGLGSAVNVTPVEINGTTQYYYETANGNVYVVVQVK